MITLNFSAAPGARRLERNSGGGCARKRCVRFRQPRWRLVYLMSVFRGRGSSDAPYVWRALPEWLGHSAALADLCGKMGFGVWWPRSLRLSRGILLR